MRVMIVVVFLLGMGWLSSRHEDASIPAWQKVAEFGGFMVAGLGALAALSMARREDLEDKERAAALKRQPSADNTSLVPAGPEKGGQS